MLRSERPENTLRRRMSSTKDNTKISSIFNLEEQIIFYGSYHSNVINKAIHMICVWPILWTALALFASLGVVAMPAVIADNLPLKLDAWNLHIATPLMLVYGVVYCVMDPLAGGLATVMIVACYVTSNLWIAGGGVPTIAGAIHVLCWLAQFYGHGVHEGRAPALLDNFFQAFLASPLFVLLEVLFEFGYKKELYKRVQEQVSLNIAEYQATQGNKVKKEQ